ncbi:MAG: glycoside hydrolase family protein [Candidatus Omnitrophica bacterium]|nr:glycoside hydrolase family protein [Candidatus Omnitrophota bacterium]
MDQANTDLLSFIRLNEGLRLKPYRCPAGKWTIGVGYNMEAHGIPGWMVDKIMSGRGITEQDSDRLLIEEVAKCISACKSIVPGFSGLSHNRQIALVDMCFNLGPGGLSKFRNMLAAITAGDWERAARSAQSSKWYTQVKMRGVRVVKMLRDG